MTPPSTRFTVARELRFVESNGELVVMDTRAQHLVGIAGVGAAAFQRWARGESFGATIDALLLEYEVDRATLEADLAGLVAEAGGRGWLVIDRSS